MPLAAAWKHTREFRALLTANLISLAGDQFTRVALLLSAYERTGSGLASASILGTIFVTQLVAGPLLSPLADRWPRKPVILTSLAGQTVAVAAMAALMWAWPHGAGVLIPLTALVIAGQLLRAPGMAAITASVRVVVPKADYPDANRLRQVTTSLVQLAGLGGAGLLVGALGPVWALLLDTATFLVTLAVVAAGLRPRPAARALDCAGRGEWSWSAGARVVLGDRRLRLLLALSWLAGFAVVPEGIAPALAIDIGGSSALVGWLLAIDPATYALAGMLLRHLPEGRQRHWMGPLAVLSLLPLLLFALTPPVWLAFVLLAISGAAASYQITASTLFTEAVPTQHLGAAHGVASTGLQSSQGLGIMLGGALSELLGSASLAIAAAAAVGVCAAALTARAWAAVPPASPEHGERAR